MTKQRAETIIIIVMGMGIMVAVAVLSALVMP